jgi:hypothetical protein
VNTKSPAYHLVSALLRVALLVTLIGAGWSVYHKLPRGGGGNGVAETSDNTTSETTLQLILQPSPRDEGVAVNVPIQLYPVDVAAVQREFSFEPHPGVHFEDFLKERMQGRAPIKAQLDENGKATVMVAPGKWWVHAVLAGSQNVEWRLPVNVSGRQQTVELNSENMYARTKSF